MKHVIFFAAALAAALIARVAVSASPDPANEKSSVAPLRYQSPFQDYRRLADDKPIPWRDANDEVGRIGGWRAYAKEAMEATEMPKPAVAIMPQQGVPQAKAVAPGKLAPGAHRHDQHK